MTATSLEYFGKATESLTDIKLEDIDFEAVDKCTSAAKLGRYITLLEADGGYYRELLTKAKEKLLRVDRKAYYKLYPNSVVASPREAAAANSTVLMWEQELKSVDREARERSEQAPSDLGIGGKAYPIREVVACDQQRQEPVEHESAAKEEADDKARNPYARDMTAMKDYYRAWDRFDVDAACDAVDVKAAKQEEGVVPPVAPLDIDQDLSPERVESMSAAERAAECEAEKIKGNESFTSGELDEAELHYSRALRLRSDISAIWSNRALVRLKLRRPKEGLEDAQRAIALDSKNLKAFHRRGKARAELGYLEEAVKDFQIALRLLNESGAEQGVIAKVNADLATARRELLTKQREQPKDENEDEEPKIQEIFDESPNISQDHRGDAKSSEFRRISIVDEDTETEDEEREVSQGCTASAGGWRKVEVLEDSSEED
ncbi:hypothetical protein FOL46_004024 [Perkinsus olseni]|uniref:RNA polymerase II-associated protein 3 n=1 Tax=Perkinsus olseni TaxID=32597 RepID=A0A7J6MTB3_PEROL|nr:hypothetical protein FOL46_004024 [Perkinsus olseni]